MRLDQFLVKENYFASRNKALIEIKDGNIKVNGKIVKKASFDVEFDDDIEVIGQTLSYVSRGGLKLEKALEEFKINPKGCTCLDIGASTGGFTDCLLKHQAKEVYAVDTGTDQLDVSLKKDPRVHSMEKTNFLTMDLSALHKIDLIVIDVSFISVIKILERILNSFKDVVIIFLIKPQFELGRVYLKDGVVRNEIDRQNVITKIVNYLKVNNIQINEKVIDSPILGGSGNKEYLSSFIIK